MEIIALLRELIPCLFTGYLLGKFKKNLSLFVARPLIDYGIPISLMGILLKAGLNIHLIEAAAVALVAISLLMALLVKNPWLKANISSPALQLGSSFGNTGYFGIPVSLALLPSQALSYSIGFDLGATLLIWSLGPYLLTKKNNQSKEIKQFKRFLNALTTSPASKGLIGALIIKITPWNEQITSALWIPSRIIIVLALLVLGMRLGWLGTSPLSTIKPQFAAIKNSLIMKLVCFPGLMLIVCLLFRLPDIMRDALVLQAAAPTAISVLLIAEANSYDEDKVTSLVVITALLALGTIPMWALALGI